MPSQPASIGNERRCNETYSPRTASLASRRCRRRCVSVTARASVTGHIESVKRPCLLLPERRIDVTPRELSGTVVEVGDGQLTLALHVDGSGRASIARFGATELVDFSSDALRVPPLPLVDVVVAGSGGAWSGGRYVESAVGARLRVESYDQTLSGSWKDTVLRSRDPITQLAVELRFRVLRGAGAMTVQSQLTNTSSRPLCIESVTSLILPGLEGPGGELAEAQILWAENEWLAEGRWQERPLRDVLPDLVRSTHEHDPRGCFRLTSSGSWSSGMYLPMGAVVNERTGHSLVWQIEHNGAWHWQVGEYSALERHSEWGNDSTTSAYLALLGPTTLEHAWWEDLAPGASFETVPVTVAVSDHAFAGALAAMTTYRRKSRRHHRDNETLPVVFNDYMNTLMGDPTTGRLLPLIDAAAEIGAEIFCIDAGWFCPLGDSGWATAGSWEVSPDRFPDGIAEVIERIRGHGMTAGLWLEPEIIGTRSGAAHALPDEAFFVRHGQRVLEHDRYHLDLRHPAARQHLDETVDHLVSSLGIGFLKLDYNINAGLGTDRGGSSPGSGLLGHNRAFLDWLDGLHCRHPGLTIETCASGGMRTDHALLSRCQIHSTSDEQDLQLYAPIAAAAPAAIAPEQAGIWAYAQPEHSPEEMAFTLTNGLLGRLYLSGHLDRMTSEQRSLVAEAVSCYKQHRHHVREAVPFWPTGLPRWTDEWVTLGMRAPEENLVTVWRREAKYTASPENLVEQIALELPHLRGHEIPPTVVFPSESLSKVTWDASAGRLHVEFATAPSACVIAFSGTD